MIRGFLAGVQGYPGLFLLCATAGLLQPFPQDVSLVYAGIRLQSGDFAWGLALLVSIAGVLTRDVLMFWVGHFLGGWLFRQRWLARILRPERVQRTHELIEARGAMAVFLGRFLVGMRATVFLVAGAGGLSFRRFLVWDLLGALLTVPLTVAAGYWFGPPLVGLSVWLIARFRIAILVVIVLGLGLWLVGLYRRQRGRALGLED